MVAQHINRFSEHEPVLPPSHAVLSDALDDVGRKSAATAVGLSPALVHKWCEPAGESGTLNPLDRVVALSRVANTTKLAEWICAQLGGVFVPLPAPVLDVSRCINTVTRDVAGKLFGTLDVLVEAGGDGVIDQKETEAFRCAWQGTVGSVESVVRATESGLFAAESVVR